MKQTQIKICGITTGQEAEILNMEQADYAGFVFYEKSKRHIGLQEAREIMKELKPTVKKVAVTVNPGEEMVRDIMAAGFDILQVHGGISDKVLQQCEIPIWYAVNVSDGAGIHGQLHQCERQLEQCRQRNCRKTTCPFFDAYVIDGAHYGSGSTFAWDTLDQKTRMELKKRRLVLAGGLNASNVTAGMELFKPDIVDASSSLEGDNGKKDAKKIKEFIRKVREYA